VKIMIDVLSKEEFKRISKLNKKKYRDHKQGNFDILLEGERLISQVYTYGVCIKAIYCRIDKLGGFSDLLTQIHCPKYTLSMSQSDALSETENNPGIYAQVHFKTEPINTYDNIYFLNGISDPGNLGSIFRTASAFGVHGLVLDEHCCDLANSKVVRSSLGAIFSVPTLRVNDSWLSTQKATICACTLPSTNENTISIHDFKMNQSSHIFVIGSEAHGISESILNLSDHHIFIPMIGKTESVNASVAFALLANNINLKSFEKN
jgi:TrmH family RNA methyltransferase